MLSQAYFAAALTGLPFEKRVQALLVQVHGDADVGTDVGTEANKCEFRLGPIAEADGRDDGWIRAYGY